MTTTHDGVGQSQVTCHSSPGTVQTYSLQEAVGIRLKGLLVCNKYRERLFFPQFLNPVMLNNFYVNQI